MPRPPVAFLAWTAVAGRPVEIAAALDGEAQTYYDLGIVRRSLVPLRYALSAARTAAYLATRRPRALIVTNPPVFPALLGYVYSRVAGVPLALDSHQDAFDEDGGQARFIPLHRWLTPRVAGTLVPSELLLERVEAWGGRGAVVHEAPPGWQVSPPGPLRARPRILFVGTFSPDEPVADVLEAARRLTTIDLRVTGDLRKCAPGLRRSAPPNVCFVGFRRGGDFVQELAAADIVLVLTSKPNYSTPRSGYEAVYAQRPLAITDTPLLRATFPHAVHVAAGADGVEWGLGEAIDRHAELVAHASEAFTIQRLRWERQLTRLRTLLARAGAEFSAS